jgi:hypothetical protein
MKGAFQMSYICFAIFMWREPFNSGREKQKIILRSAIENHSSSHFVQSFIRGLPKMLRTTINCFNESRQYPNFLAYIDSQWWKKKDLWVQGLSQKSLFQRKSYE